jgi:predicted O-methyltransferase YrrM
MLNYNDYSNNLDEDWFNFQSFYTEMVEKFSDESHFVEVGCHKGRSSLYLAIEVLNSKKNIKLDFIDIWDGNLFEIFSKNMEPVKEKYTAYKLASKEASELYSNKSLDFVFIDANHNYEFVYEDIKIWLPKIKSGGILAGHDYNHPVWPGVKKAVDELLGPDNIYITCEYNEYKTWVYNVKD